MKVSLRRASPGDSTPPEGADGHPWSGASAIATKLAKAALYAALACGPAALIFAALGSASPGQSGPAQVDELSTADLAERGRVAEFAERAVVTWLTATQDTREAVKAELGVDPGVGLPTVSPVASDASAAAVETLDGGMWSVVVGVDVAVEASSDTTTDPSAGLARRYFQVAIAVGSGGEMGLQALPAAVPGPVVRAAFASPYRSTVAVSTPIGVTAQEFLNALLAGSGALERVLAPGVRMAPITPAPYRRVAVTHLSATAEPEEEPQDGAEIRVLVTATVDAAPGAQTVQYPLSLRARAGRWEVAAIDPAPPAERDTNLGTPSPGDRGNNPTGQPTVLPTSEREK